MISVLDLANAVDVQRLRSFSELDHPSTFRYFKNRQFEKAIQSHVVTLLYDTYCYAHIDYDDPSGRHYLGICVMPEYQGHGIGDKLINLLLKLHREDTYLTVDVDNVAAIALYEKYGFQREPEQPSGTVYTYVRRKPLLLEVSAGEAVDKLTILDIKLEKIQNAQKRTQVQVERDHIYGEIRAYVDKAPRFYHWLKYINTMIWVLQDDVREQDKASSKLLMKILDLNDMRFRVKKRINDLFQGTFQEQKGYGLKSGLFLGHLGLGDMINLNGAIRFSALLVDQLYVICKRRNTRNIQLMFADDPSIKVIECQDDDSDVQAIVNNKRHVQLSPSKVSIEPYFTTPITHKFFSGGYAGNIHCADLPDCFYDDLNYHRDVKHVFAHFNISEVEQLQVPSMPFIFTHDSSSYTHGLGLEHKLNINDILVIDPNRNYYANDHKWFALAQSFLNKPLLSYMTVIQRAQEIHVTDSSFYCLCCFIDTKAQVKLCYDRASGQVITRYNFS